MTCNFLKVLFFIALFGNSLWAQTKIIWDSDMAWDWDDVGALAVLHALADAGDAEILGMGSSTRSTAGKWNPYTMDIINTYYNRPDIPIGKSLSGPNVHDVYGQWISQQGFPYDLDSNQVWDNVVELYRKLLSEQADNSVVIVTVGYTSNIRDLMLSKPDKYSNLNGMDLINKKVDFWSCMAGKYPGSGTEANMQDWRGYTKYAFDNFPRPILGTSSEAGNVSGAGKSLEFTPLTNPVRAIYRKRLDEQGYPNTFSHSTWDLIATLVAVRDPNLYFDVTASGTNVITINGDNSQSNKWQSSPDNGFRYLIQTDHNNVSNVLDDLISRAPAAVQINTPNERHEENTEFPKLQVYPNPFNPSSSMNFIVSEANQVSLDVFNLQGKRIHEIIDRSFCGGGYHYVWKAKHLPSSTYIVRFKTNKQVVYKKIYLVK